jgi:hypothetical protein
MMRMRLLTAVVVGAMALVSPMSAHAASTNYYYGWLNETVPSENDCIWYYLAGEACSGWNYWTQSDWVTLSCGPSSMVNVGFQNNDRIRHTQLPAYSNGQCITIDVTTSYLGMGGYLKAHVMWGSGAQTYGEAWAYT